MMIARASRSRFCSNGNSSSLQLSESSRSDCYVLRSDCPVSENILYGIHNIETEITAIYNSRARVCTHVTTSPRMIYPRSFSCPSYPKPGNSSFSQEPTPRGKNARDFRRWMQASRCHGNTRRNKGTSLTLPVALPTRWLRKKRRERIVMMKKRGRHVGSFKRRNGHSIESLSYACASCLPRLIGTVACAEHIGKAIREGDKNRVARHSPSLARYFLQGFHWGILAIYRFLIIRRSLIVQVCSDSL